MTFRLKINQKLDEKLLQNFPKDPYADIVVVTQTHQLQLSLAYLAIDSRYFAGLPSSCTHVNLSHLNEHFAIYVLRALYGGELQANNVADLQEIFKVVDFLQIDQFRQCMEAGLRRLHEERKDASPLNQIEMIQFCIRTGVVREEVLNYHFASKLKLLESSKNYLQLGKLSDPTLNTILLQFLGREGEAGESVVNHILENYFNRKSYRPADYFTDPFLSPLRVVWEKYHHKVSVRPRLEKTTSIQQLKETAPLSSTPTAGKFGRLANLPAISTHSVNLTSELLKSQGDDLMDLRIQALGRELQQKNRKLQALQAEMKELLEVKAKREEGKRQMEASIDDESLFKNVLRSRKSREEQLKTGDNSTSEVAYDNVKLAVQQQREKQPPKLVPKNSAGKKMFS